uniref:Uncharacterized protein n=1 Tax=Parastrongyloides trichosuri TaxID=131310 RepID=A0A0N4ZJP9_PARTI
MTSLADIDIKSSKIEDIFQGIQQQLLDKLDNPDDFCVSVQIQLKRKDNKTEKQDFPEANKAFEEMIAKKNDICEGKGSCGVNNSNNENEFKDSQNKKKRHKNKPTITKEFVEDDIIGADQICKICKDKLYS